MSQPTAYANGFSPSHSQHHHHAAYGMSSSSSTMPVAGLVPTPFTQSALPNGHVNGGARMQQQQSAADQYNYWSNYQQQ